MRNLIQIVENARSDYFFGYDFGDAEMAFINAQPQTGSVACEQECGRWMPLLVEQGFDVEIMLGFYHDQGHDAVGHAWLLVNGVIFDPTASQFADYPDIDDANYDAHERYDMTEYMNR